MIVSPVGEVFRHPLEAPRCFPVRLSGRESRPESLLERSRAGTEHVAWVTCVSSQGSNTVIEIRRADMHGWTDVAKLRHVAAVFCSQLPIYNKE